MGLLGLTELKQTQIQLPADACANRNCSCHRPPRLAKCSFMDWLLSFAASFQGHPCSALAELKEGQRLPSPSPLQLPSIEQIQPPFQLPQRHRLCRMGEEQARLTTRSHGFPQDSAGVQQGKGVWQQVIVPRGCGAGDGQVVLQGWAPLRSLEQQDLDRGTWGTQTRSAGS